MSDIIKINHIIRERDGMSWMVMGQLPPEKESQVYEVTVSRPPEGVKVSLAALENELQARKLMEQYSLELAALVDRRLFVYPTSIICEGVSSESFIVGLSRLSEEQKTEVAMRLLGATP